MFARRLQVLYGEAPVVEGSRPAHHGPADVCKPCPLAWIDNFAMRNFTNDAIFDDTLPVADGLLEVGYRVPLEPLRSAMTDWFRRKGYLTAAEILVLRDVS